MVVAILLLSLIHILQQGSDDDCVYLPYTTAMRLSSQSTVNNYAAVMEDAVSYTHLDVYKRQLRP